MPEGPEVWILSEAICRKYQSNISKSFGKHLLIPSSYCNCEDMNVESLENSQIIWSFGLNGKISINSNDKLYKPTEENWVFGKNKMLLETETIDEHLKISNVDWMNSNANVLDKFVKKISKSRGKLGPALINQSNICGIGVAWGSEILHRANLRPELSANKQDLSKLCEVMCEIRNEIKELYKNELNNYEDPKDFIEGWFENLYQIRDMKVYDKTESMSVNGRNWWVYNSDKKPSPHVQMNEQDYLNSTFVNFESGDEWDEDYHGSK